MARPAAAGHKGDHRFAGKILPVQEGLDGGGHGVPPGGRAHGDRIVIFRTYGDGLSSYFIVLSSLLFFEFLRHLLQQPANGQMLGAGLFALAALHAI